MVCDVCHSVFLWTWNYTIYIFRDITGGGGGGVMGGIKRNKSNSKIMYRCIVYLPYNFVSRPQPPVCNYNVVRVVHVDESSAVRH